VIGPDLPKLRVHINDVRATFTAASHDVAIIVCRLRS
jgi:hypothetical protein